MPHSVWIKCNYLIFTEICCTLCFSGYTSNRSVKTLSQPAFTCSKLTIETLEQGVKYVQS